MARKEAIDRLHKNLQDRRTELYKRLRMDMTDLQQSHDGTGDEADAAFDTTSAEIASQLAGLESKELKQIERALLRLQQGNYGICEICNKKIPVMRLNALPFSTLCIQCQVIEDNDSAWRDRRESQWEKLAAQEPDDQPERISQYDLKYSR